MKTPYRHRFFIGAGAVLLTLASGCAPGSDREGIPAPAIVESPAGTNVYFTDVGAKSGIDFIHVSGSPEQRYIIEAMTAGAAFLDYDNDRYLDLFLVNATVQEDPPPEAGNRLYRNVASSSAGRVFQDVTEGAGLQHSGWGTGCATGDYDNDGDVDLYLTYWGPNMLYRNEGNGRFTDVTLKAEVGDQRWGASAAFGDVDGDGYLDLYVTNYLAFSLDPPPNGGKLCQGWKDLETFCGPHGMMPQGDVLYRNEGNGRFTDKSALAGIDQHVYPGLGVVFTDYDNDGDADIYVANDSAPNLLFRNDGNWQLTEMAAFAGVAYSEEGRAQAGMGVDAGDYDNDGDQDLFTTNFSDDVNTLYQNLGDGSFADATAAAGLGGEDRPFLGWSTAFFDADNNGWLDLYVANGHLYPQLETRSAGLRYAQRNLLYWNEGGRFRRADPQQGLATEKVSRGTALGDYDNDGDTDLLVMNLNDTPTLLRNDGGNRHNWLGFELVGVESNRDGIGAQIRLFSGPDTLLQEVKRGYGYQSQHDGRVLFGLGRKESVERVEIRWPSGRLQLIERPPLRRYLVVREGSQEPVANYYVGPVDLPAAALTAPPQESTGSQERAPYIGRADWKAEDHYRHGVRLYKQARYEEALEAFRAAVQGKPDYTPAFYSLGVTLYSGLGRSKEAAVLLEKAVAQDSSNAELLELLGRVYLSLDQATQAIAVLIRAAALDPSSWERHHRLGLAHLRSGDWAAASRALQRAASIAPWAPMPHLDLARVYEKLGRAGPAEKQRLIFAKLKRLQEREDIYLQQIKEEPVDSEAHYRLGREYMKQGRYTEALV